MADTKVSDLNSITVAGSNDILYIVNPTAGTSNKITYENLLSGVNDSITSLTSEVNTFTTTVLELSSEFQAANLDVGPLTTDILIVSGGLNALSAELNELYDNVEKTVGVGLSQDVTISGTTLTFLSGVLTQVT